MIGITAAMAVATARDLLDAYPRAGAARSGGCCCWCCRRRSCRTAFCSLPRSSPPSSRSLCSCGFADRRHEPARSAARGRRARISLPGARAKRRSDCRPARSGAGFESRRWPDRGVIATFSGGRRRPVRGAHRRHLSLLGHLADHAPRTLRRGRRVEPLVAESATRVTGWLFDQEHGLLPVRADLSARPGWMGRAVETRSRALRRLISGVGAYVAVMTIPMLNAHGWRGGWTPAARFLVPVAPFLAILAFGAVAHLRRIPAIVLAIVALQVVSRRDRLAAIPACCGTTASARARC